MARPKGSGRIYRRGRVWWIRYFALGGHRYETSKSENRADAERLLKQRLGEIASGRFQSAGGATVGTLLDLVIRDYRLTRKRSLADLEYRVNSTIRELIGKLKAAKFGINEIDRYVQVRSRTGAADGTINRELAIIRRGFTLGKRQNPPIVTQMPYFPKIGEETVREGFIEDDQYRTILAALPDRLKAIFVAGFHLGMRLGELRNLKWEQVDFVGDVIRLQARQTKGKKARTAPIYGDLKPFLEMQRDTQRDAFPECKWVFNWRTKRIGAHLKGWRKACKKAGLSGLMFHDLRRSAVRNMERAGIPRNVAMGISGHRTESVYRRYDIVSEQDIANARTKLQEYQNQKRPMTPDQKSVFRTGKIQ